MKHELTPTTQEAFSDGLPIAENNLKANSTLVENTPLKGTPFVLRKQNEKWFLTMGDHRITEPTETQEEQILKLTIEHWSIQTTVTAIIVEKMLKDDWHLYGTKQETQQT